MKSEINSTLKLSENDLRIYSDRFPLFLQIFDGINNCEELQTNASYVSNGKITFYKTISRLVIK